MKVAVNQQPDVAADFLLAALIALKSRIVIAEEVRHQYNIVYRPEPLVNDGLFHKVEIRVKGHKELSVRARSGYYARKS